MADPRDLPPPPDFAALRESERVALFLDFDGTLVEIAPTPDSIAVPDDLSLRLEDLARRLDGRLAVVSGRSPEDLAGHTGRMAVAIAGSHGIARQRPDGSTLGNSAEGIPEELRGRIERIAGEVGADIERKTHGMAIHYRSAPHLGEQIIDASRDLAAETQFELKLGKCVVEFVRPGATKAGAVEAFMAEPEFSGSLPIFVGDDVTDEDGFRAASALGGFGIAVGERESEGARFHLSDVRDVYAWLNL
ncbi:trehalose-phosphatase [Erythrobacter sp. HKB08]|uniref:trehalose-phosphatase n=1 Tax=Erythrobacter sp. HKB08 TaxID=2502843 RepID=UPI0010091770|nr:trehalose-phosphatase [Erythrobacter sp. HKB08]